LDSLASVSAVPSRKSAPRQATFETCLRVLRPGDGTLSSLGVYCGDLNIPLDAFAAGLGDHKIITTPCPGGKERMRRLMSVINGASGPGVDGDAPIHTRWHRIMVINGKPST
jgi:threonine dehydrogenase-like Zn-dependent dehydrogenase